MPIPLLPLFPLPNVVLFPNVFLPLHVFEPRYRDMVNDALAADRIIGVILLRERRKDYRQDIPAVFPIGCSGLITHCERLGDGRFDIVLRGLEKFRILSEDLALSYRRAEIETINEPTPTPHDLREERHRLEQLLEERLATTAPKSPIPPEMQDADFVNALAQHLEFEPLEKQTLLERPGVRARCQALVNLLEMKSLIRNGQFPSSSVQ